MTSQEFQSKTTTNPLLEAALDWARRGFPVLPLWWPRDDGSCACGTDCGKNACKHPLEALAPNGVYNATQDENIISKWWELYPDANIGIAMGNGFLAVDIDIKNKANGLNTFLNLNLFFDTLTHRTPSGGWHVIYETPEDFRNQVHDPLLPGIDIRSAKSYIVAPPSRTAEGPYSVDMSRAPEPLPSTLKSILQPPAGAQSNEVFANLDGEASIHQFTQIAKNYPPSIQGQGGNNRLFAIAAMACREYALSVETAIKILYEHFNPRCDPPWGEYEFGNFEGTIRNGAEYGRSAIGEKSPERFVESIERPPESLIPPECKQGDAVEAAGGKKAIERQTDLGNARRLIRMYGQDIRFVHAWKKWLLWDGKGWAIDTNGGVMRLAKATIESLHDEAQTEADDERRKKARQYASSCEAVRRLRGMIELAESEESVTLDPQAIDADPWLLGVQNGVIELKTGTFRPARREDYILNQAGVSYDASATCPEWLKFLEKFVVDKERISYLQRVAGYILTGLVREEALFLLFGKGRNGKSTFREILFAMLGTYATIGDVTLIMERKQSGGGPTPEVDRLRGKRLVTINETEENAVIRDERIKAISSNDHLTARALYEGFTDFMPTHKTVITTNHKPIVKGSDDGIWARLHPLRFGVKITPEEEAKDYRERVLVPELAGTLNWALEGLKAYIRDGLKVPAAVEKERTEYRHEMDRVGQWLEDRCGDDLDKGDAATETLVSLLYADYELHSKSESGFAVSKTRFGRELGERGYSWVKRGGKKYRKGLRLLYTMPGGDVLVKPEQSAPGDVVAGPWPKAS